MQALETFRFCPFFQTAARCHRDQEEQHEGKEDKGSPPDENTCTHHEPSQQEGSQGRILSFQSPEHQIEPKTQEEDLGDLGEYEGDLNVDERIVSDLLTACKVVAKAITEL